ncbi:MAG: hypothetical protein AAB483_02665 [Patescibacteria group bacterium]
MNILYKQVLVVGIFLSIAFGVVASAAQAVTIPSRPDIKTGTDASGNTTVNRPGMDITTNNSGSTTVEIGGGARTITTQTDGSVQINDANGRIISVTNNQDLDAYASLVIQEQAAITDIEIKSNEIRIEYRQPAKFLGLFSSTLNGTVVVMSGGNVEIDLPWYGFLFRKNAGAVRKAIETQLQAGATNGTLQVDIIGTGTGSNATMAAGNSAQVITIVSSTLATQAQVPSATQTPAPAGTATPTAQSGTTIASFIGFWSGRFTPNSLAAQAGCPGGTVSFTVKADGTFQGPVNIDGVGTAFYGGGSVNNAGTMSGGWSLSGSGSVMQGTINLSGKLLASGSGSGTWNVPGGCYGAYSVKR